MESVDPANCNNRFPEFGERRRKLAVWAVLPAVVLGGTHVLFAKHWLESINPQSKSESGQHAERQATSDRKENWRAEPSCFDQATGMVGRTPVSLTWVLMSPDGRYGAYAVNEAVPTKSNGEIVGCKSTSKLFVTGPGRENAEAVLVMQPSEEMSGNSIELIDWSPKGHRLLIVEGFWVWASDAGGIEARIYDAESGKLSSEGEFRAAFRRYAGRNCVVTLQPMGFSSSGKAVVVAWPDADEEGIVQNGSCVTRRGIWMVDPASFGIIRAQDEFKVKKYGKKGE